MGRKESKSNKQTKITFFHTKFSWRVISLLNWTILLSSYSLVNIYVLGAQKNRLIETVLLSTHNKYFGWEMRRLVLMSTHNICLGWEITKLFFDYNFIWILAQVLNLQHMCNYIFLINLKAWVITCEIWIILFVSVYTDLVHTSTRQLMYQGSRYPCHPYRPNFFMSLKFLVLQFFFNSPYILILSKLVHGNLCIKARDILAIFKANLYCMSLNFFSSLVFL